jgi:hypothetical protein
MSKSPIISIIKCQNLDNENHSGINENQWNVNNLSHYKLKENIEEYVDFTKLNTIYDLFNLMEVVICPSDKHIINIEDLYYTSDYVYQAIFKSVSKDGSYTMLLEDSNKLATQMLGEKHIVDGNMIIVKRSIINKEFDYVDISIDDITQILRNQFIHKAVIIKPITGIMSLALEETIEEQYYVYNPLEINFGQSHIDNVRYHEFKFLEYRLFFHIDINAERTNNNFNKMASVIYGKNIYGNVLISLSDNSDSTPLNLDITPEIITQIYYITICHKINNTEIDKKKYGRKLELENKNIEDYNSEIHKDFKHNNFPEITMSPNFFQVIKLEYNFVEKYTSHIEVDKYTDNSILNDII